MFVSCNPTLTSFLFRKIPTLKIFYRPTYPTDRDRKQTFFLCLSTRQLHNCTRNIFYFYFLTVTWVRGRQLKMTFSTSSVPSTEKLQLAELRVRHPRRHCGNSHHGNRMIKVKYFNEQGKRFASKIYPIELYKDSSEDMSALDVTQVLQESHGVAANVELILKCDKSKTNHNKVVRTKRDIFHGMESGDAFILIFSKSGDIFKNLDTASNSSLIDTRPKRELETALQTKGGRKRNKNKRKDCSRRKFYIDFKALGWSQWIIYPKRFNAYYCGGECPLPVDQYYEPTNHAVMQSLMKLRRPDSRVPAPCCVPGKLSPLSMLYFENEDIVVRHHEGMVVDRCSCK